MSNVIKEYVRLILEAEGEARFRKYAKKMARAVAPDEEYPGYYRLKEKRPGQFRYTGPERLWVHMLKPMDGRGMLFTIQKMMNMQGEISVSSLNPKRIATSSMGGFELSNVGLVLRGKPSHYFSGILDSDAEMDGSRGEYMGPERMDDALSGKMDVNDSVWDEGDVSQYDEAWLSPASSTIAGLIVGVPKKYMTNKSFEEAFKDLVSKNAHVATVLKGNPGPNVWSFVMGGGRKVQDVTGLVSGLGLK